MQAKMKITRKAFFRYTLLPEFLTRFKSLIGNGFTTLAYLIAMIYNATGILPSNHAFLKSENIGQYGIRHVIFESYRNITFDRNHIDQIIIFFAIAIGIVLLLLQFIVLGFTILTNAAMAGGWYSQFFVTPFPDDDIAFRMLYLVFGTDMFGSGGTPFPIHYALYSLFEFYSYGILVIGAFIIAYFVTTVIGETAQTGIPFGKRFMHVWVPIRLILFFALIIPITNGLNGAQWLTLSSAKYGSSLATNGWIRFNQALASDPLGSTNSLVATPNSPEFQNIVAFMMIAKTCQWAEGRQYGKAIDAYLVYEPGASGSTEFMSTPYIAALTQTRASGSSAAGNITIRFGEKKPGARGQTLGAVKPDCGEIILNTTDLAQPGAFSMQAGYYGILKLLWADGGALDNYAGNYSRRYQSTYPQSPNAPIPDAEFKSVIALSMNSAIQSLISNAVAAQLSSLGGMDSQMIRSGWGGAAIWYNRIAEQNGSLTSAVFNIPDIKLYPSVMEYVRTQRMQNNRNVPLKDRFNPRLANGAMINFIHAGDAEVARTLNQVYQYWNRDLRTDAGAVAPTNNAFIDAINAILGSQGLFDMCRNTDTHPLAQLSSVGKGLVDAAVENLAMAAGFGILGGTGVLQAFGPAAQSASGFYGTIGTVSLMAGFTLFYVLPFMPFIYFFFAVGGWVKTVFEAMVGVPLWALAHLRIDGEGLSGQAATSGYFLLLEIFLRPIMIVFGLLAAIVIFAAQVKVLNEIFHLASSAIGGGSRNFTSSGGCYTAPASGLGPADLGTMTGAEQFVQGPFNTFAFTIMYAVLVYMMGMASFKLIDLIPNQIMRWFGSSASSFSDDNEPSRGAEGLLKYSTIGAGAMGSQISEAVTSVPDAFDAAGQESARRSELEVNILATDPELMPKHNSDLRGLENKADNLLTDIEELQNNGATQAEIDQAIADNQDIFNNQIKPDLDRIVGKQEAIIGRVEELGGQGNPSFNGQRRDFDTIQSNLQEHLQQKYRIQIQ